MKEHKTIKIYKETHPRLKLLAAKTNLPIVKLVDKLVEEALNG